ncbi:hypothetical protein [Corynebacterium sputi]|uniref:hypothetical protein n=1 Tax=Corynebacterium sputi TaxID=489915 RepID=UPI0003F666D9|nr:hypothetical protein [Corynebacterium sputi]
MNESTTWLSKSRVIALIFVAVLVVAGLVLFFARGSEDSPTAAPATHPDGEDSVQAEQWAGKTADRWGTMVYFPVDSRGQILSERLTKRDPADPSAQLIAPEGVVMQYTDVGSTGMPVPFSTTDGPTGFDGTLPTGFSQSGAGAGLAAAHWVATMWTEDTDVVDDYAAMADGFSQKNIERRKRMARGETGGNLSDEMLSMPAAEAYKITAWDGDYARVTAYFRDHKDDVDFYLTYDMDLRYSNGQWIPLHSDTSTSGEAGIARSLDPGAVRWALR